MAACQLLPIATTMAEMARYYNQKHNTNVFTNDLLINQTKQEGYLDTRLVQVIMEKGCSQSIPLNLMILEAIELERRFVHKKKVCFYHGRSTVFYFIERILHLSVERALRQRKDTQYRNKLLKLISEPYLAKCLYTDSKRNNSISKAHNAISADYPFPF